MAKLSGLPVELLEQICSHMLEERRIPSEEAGLDWREKPRYDLTALTRVNKHLHNVTLRLIWRTVDRFALDVLFAMLRERRDVSDGSRFRQYVNAVRSIEMDDEICEGRSNHWMDIEHAFDPSTADARVLKWRASGFFPKVESLSVVLDNHINIFSFVPNFLGCLPSSLITLKIVVFEGLESRLGYRQYDVSEVLGHLGTLCFYAITTFKQTLRSLSITGDQRHESMRWSPELSQLQHLDEFCDLSPLTNFKTLGYLARLPTLSSIRVEALEGLSGVSIRNILLAEPSDLYPFQVLQKLTCSSTMDVLTAFLDVISTSPLRQLWVRVTAPRQPVELPHNRYSTEELRTFATVLGQFAGTLNDVDLAILVPVTNIDIQPFRWSDLNGIYMCHRVEFFSFNLISRAPIDLTDQDLASMACSFPHLRRLRLCWMTAYQPDTSGLVDCNALTLNGLEPLRRHCGSLDEITISWLNARIPHSLPPLPFLPRPVSKLDFMILGTHGGEREVDANVIDETNAAGVASYLRRFWPELQLRLGTHFGGRSPLKDDRRIEESTDDPDTVY